jgi:uncharacterized membrane protein
MRISILVIASVLALILAGCHRAEETPPADPPLGAESAVPTPEPTAPAAAPGTTSAGRETSTRSSTFRAQGNEPGWMAEVALGDPPSMHAEVDHGETRFEIPNAIEDQTGWSGTAADGTQVALRFERVECIDNMSGEKFEARAVLAAAGKEYEGCGRFRPNRP